MTPQGVCYNLCDHLPVRHRARHEKNKHGLRHHQNPGRNDWARYLESLKDGREVWLDGEKIQDITTHPAFTGMVHELARIYDLQHTEKYRDEMTFISPETGNRCSVSWLLPRSMDDLKKKRRNSEIWNEQC